MGCTRSRHEPPSARPSSEAGHGRTPATERRVRSEIRRPKHLGGQRGGGSGNRGGETSWAARVANSRGQPTFPPRPPAAPSVGHPYEPLAQGQNYAIFFPDSAMPCRYARSARGCHRRGCQYAHGETSLTKFLDELRKAERTLDICVFTITCNEIADTIIECIRNGVAVRLITDDAQMDSNGSDVHALARAGAMTRHDNNMSSHMHNKFAVIDRSTLLNGSFNWTRSAVLSNRENVVISNDQWLVSQFAVEFDKLWKQFAGRANIVKSTAL